MQKIQKTNAARLLDRAGVAYRLIPYTVDENNLAADHVAAELGEGLTGYIRGGCSPVGMKKPFPTFIHSTATQFPEIFVSAGIRGLQFAIAPQALIDYTGAQVADIVTGPAAGEEDAE